MGKPKTVRPSRELASALGKAVGELPGVADSVASFYKELKKLDSWSIEDQSGFGPRIPVGIDPTQLDQGGLRFDAFSPRDKEGYLTPPVLTCLFPTPGFLAQGVSAEAPARLTFSVIPTDAFAEECFVKIYSGLQQELEVRATDERQRLFKYLRSMTEKPRGTSKANHHLVVQLQPLELDQPFVATFEISPLLPIGSATVAFLEVLGEARQLWWTRASASSVERAQWLNSAIDRTLGREGSAGEAESLRSLLPAMKLLAGNSKVTPSDLAARIAAPGSKWAVTYLDRLAGGGKRRRRGSVASVEDDGAPADAVKRASRLLRAAQDLLRLLRDRALMDPRQAALWVRPA